MNTPREILFLNLSNDDVQKLGEDRKKILKCIRALPSTLKDLEETDLKETNSVADIKTELTVKTSALIVWINQKNLEVWKELNEHKNKDITLHYVAFIVIFDFNGVVNKEVLDDATLQRIHPFVFPFHPVAFKSYIVALVKEMQYRKSLSELKNEFIKDDQKKSNRLNTIVKIALEKLHDHPLIGYNSATISLVDNKTNKIIVNEEAILLIKPQNRYLLKHDSPGKKKPYQDRSLQKNIKDDKLIKKVVEEIVLIFSDLKDKKLHQEYKNLGWEFDKSSTGSVNSWIGLAANRKNETIAIITIDHDESNRYESSNDKLVRFLKDFGEILANAIVDFFQQRNSRITEDIINIIGDALESKKLVTRILHKLNEELGCNSCTYFRTYFKITNDSKSKESRESEKIYFEEWASDIEEDSNATTEQTEKTKFTFKSDHGIVGNVLKNRESIIVPDACEGEFFVPTPNQSGKDLSMIAVPVFIPRNSDEPKRIIGVICCQKEEKADYFTVYDRELLEHIALITATIIERTMTLESVKDISSQMAALIVDTDREKLIETICEHALKVTSAENASIRLFKLDKKSNKYDNNNLYTVGEEDTPRLYPSDGKSTTHKVIVSMEKCEFLEGDDEYDYISEKQRKTVKCKLVVPLIINNQTTDKADKAKGELVGALYLTKKIKERFSDIEKFSLDLFAGQAASAIRNYQTLDENKLRTDAIAKFAVAINEIANKEKIGVLIQKIAEYSCYLVKAKFSYLMLKDSSGILEIKATYSRYPGDDNQLIDLRDKYNKESKESKKKGIANLVNKEPINIRDIKCIIDAKEIDAKEIDAKETEYKQNYIELDQETRSILAVPIIDNNDKIIGVINLEDDESSKFNKLHEQIIQHFARQVAIAIQKRNLIDYISDNNKILTGLQQSLYSIMQESKSAHKLLYDAVLQTRDNSGIKEVVFLFKKTNPSEQTILVLTENKIEFDCIPERDGDWMKNLKDVSLYVYNNPDSDSVYTQGQDIKNLIEKKRKQCDELNKLVDNQNKLIDNQRRINPSIQIQKLKQEQSNLNELQNKLKNKNISYGLCLPFTFGIGIEKKGVMWILFSKTFNEHYLEEDRNIYKLYANQIALAYGNSIRLEELKSKKETELTEEIKADYKTIKTQALICFGISLLTSVFGIALIIWGVSQIVKDGFKNSFNAQGTAVVGVLLQAVTILAFDRGKDANKRFDQYHQELYDVGRLRILLSATEQLDSEIISQEKQKVIQHTTGNWFKSISETPNINQVDASKNTNTNEKTNGSPNF